MGRKFGGFVKKSMNGNLQLIKDQMDVNVHFVPIKKVCYDNNLLALSPKISEEWDIALNGEKTPKNTLNGSGYKAWWQCKNGHYFKKSVADRTGTRIGNCHHCLSRGLNRKYNPPDIEKIKILLIK